MNELSWVDWVMLVCAAGVVIWLISQIRLSIWESKELHRREAITADPFKVWVDGDDVMLVTNAGSWVDYGLRQDLNVAGVYQVILEGRDRDRNMILRLILSSRYSADRVARKVRASHSVRMNPTTDWSNRDDFKELLDE